MRFLLSAPLTRSHGSSYSNRCVLSLIGLAAIIVDDVAGTAISQRNALGADAVELRATHDAGQQRRQPSDTEVGTVTIGLVAVAVQTAARQ